MPTCLHKSLQSKSFQQREHRTVTALSRKRSTMADDDNAPMPITPKVEHTKPKSKISSSRKVSLKILLLSRALEELEAEKQAREEEKVRYLGEQLPPLQVSGLSLEELQKLCKQLHTRIDQVDEERYDCEAKVYKNGKDIHELKLKVMDMGGKFKKPALRKVRVSAEEMMRALLGTKHKEHMDLRSNLKSVKKEDIKQEKEGNLEVGDWRKNVEAMSGMEGRKKMFDAGGGQ
ncbi:troponin I, slow skeletal muscle isoform X2 [Salmo salar]|uniref:Troponin I, slow skeletal muscle-like isoform X2 n=3 Tax=Salmo TaxID=8028 RepID=A0A1S3KPG2_SALSA|nr:troponin I, slow skeletal muscle isoform X2 [Salmo salar]XP_045554685.1 troponin I, slow skeletal muscle-like isoform X2 [Salmo salar]|eukprot:XP_013980480.1 PREDICTED: troponin I, slow skeletal muscle-like isoform X2 [Salmo salar]